MAKIFCLEGEWKNDPRGKHSLESALEFVRVNSGIDYTHRRISTASEFENRLAEFNRQSSYSMLMLAFPGEPGALHLRNKALTLEDLAELSGGRWKNRILHLSVGKMLKIPAKRIESFRSSTHTTLLSGFTADVDFFPAAIVEMCYLEVLRQFKTPAAIRKHLEAAQKTWVKQAGFKIFP